MARTKSKDVNIKCNELKKLISNFSKNLYLIRKYRGYTQLNVSQRSKLSLTTIADIEQGVIEDIRLGTITAIAKALKVSPIAMQSKKVDLNKI